MKHNTISKQQLTSTVQKDKLTSTVRSNDCVGKSVRISGSSKTLFSLETDALVLLSPAGCPIFLLGEHSMVLSEELSRLLSVRSDWSRSEGLESLLTGSSSFCKIETKINKHREISCIFMIIITWTVNFLFIKTKWIKTCWRLN